jgi:hypothetical protein
MTDIRVTQEDLDWWWQFAATREWTFARTYAATAPHDYIVQDRTPGVTHNDIVRAARVICTYGQPGKYYAVTKIYLVSPDGRFRWWTEDRHFTDATLVNRGTTSALYGVQNAPSTATGSPSPFDEVAATWDLDHPNRDGEQQRLTELMAPHRGQYPPHVLDLGCGTGRTLDLGLASPERYVAVDSSQGMLNVLVRKHPRVGAVYPADVRDLLTAGTFTHGRFDWVVLDASVDLDGAQRAKAAQIARRALVTVHGDQWAVTRMSSPNAHEGPAARMPSSTLRMPEALGDGRITEAESPPAGDRRQRMSSVQG